MRAPQERTVRDLYDRTRHKDLPFPEEPGKERCGGDGGGRAEEAGQHEVAPTTEFKPAVRKRPVPMGSPRVKAESGTCNVCYAPCSSCLHRSITFEDSNMDCGSSQTCCARSEPKNSLLVRSEKGFRTKGGENDDEFSATSSHASYSENGGNKVMARSTAADSEVDMPAKRRRLLNHDPRSSRVECHDDSNSCVTGLSTANKLLLDKKNDKLSTSASSRDLTVKDREENSFGHNRLRNSNDDKSTEKKRSDVHVMKPGSDRSNPADSFPTTKKLLRTQSSVGASQESSPKRFGRDVGNLQENLAHQLYKKASLSIDSKVHSLGRKSNPSMIGGDKHGNRNKIKAGCSSKDLEKDTPCSRHGGQERANSQSNNAAKRNDNDKEDRNQDCSMDISSGRKLSTQNDVTTDCGNSEGLIDVNVCDICGDVGREYLLATCTRCLEGAEHTYCMRVKLDKVPDGEWFCEECQLNEDQTKIRSNHDASTIIFDGKNGSLGSMKQKKPLQIVVPDLDAQQTTCGTATTDQLVDSNQNLPSKSIDPEARQIKCATPTAERPDAKNKNLGSMANRKRLQVTSDMAVRSSTCGTPAAGRLDKKNQSTEVLLNRKKLRVATDMESPLSSEGLLSPPKSCKRHVDTTSSSNPRLFKTESPRKHDAFSRQNSFKESNKGSSKSPDKGPVRTAQGVKSSMTLSRSYSLGSMATAKAPVPSPRGPLSKQLSFNNSNNEPKVKRLTEGVASKLKPVLHSPRDLKEKEPMRKLMKSGSFKNDDVSAGKDLGSLKQKQSFHLSQNEKPRMLKPMKDKTSVERRPSFNLQKPNIPSSPRPDSSIKSGVRKIDQDNARPGPSILKCGKKPANIEKKQSSVLSKSAKQGITVNPKSIGASTRDPCAVKTSDPPIPMENFIKDSANDCKGEASFILAKNDDETSAKPEAPSTPLAAMTSEPDLQDVVPIAASDSEDLTPNVEQDKQKNLESTGNKSSESAEAVLASEDILPESSHDLLTAHNLQPPDSKLTEMNSKHQDFLDQSSTPGDPLRTVVIPELTYIWQGIFEISRPGNPSEIYDGIQAHLSTCVSPKALEIIKQLPERMQLVEVPRCSSWPQQFKEAKPTEDNIALFFFAKDIESYERTYGKLLENMLNADLSLKTNISGIDLLIFSSDKLPEKIQRWNGLLYFWGIFYARASNSSTELVTGTDHCPAEPIAGPSNNLVCAPKVPQSLDIDLNECPDDEFPDPDMTYGVETQKSGASEDHRASLRSNHEDESLNAPNIHREETEITGQIMIRSANALPCGTYIPTSAGGGLNMEPDYPSDPIGTRAAGGDNMAENESFSLNEAPSYVGPHAGTVKSISDEILAKEQPLLSFTEVSLRHSGGPKLPDDQSESTPKADFVLFDPCSSYKRQKISIGNHSSCNLGDEELAGKCFSKIHPLPAGWHTPLGDMQYINRSPLDPGSPAKPISDNVIHVLSSDDEDSPEPSTSLNKASLKADERSSHLLPLSLSADAERHNLAGSDTGDEGSLSLSLGLPVVVKGTQALEMKQFLPEKPGINTSFLL